MREDFFLVYRDDFITEQKLLVIIPWLISNVIIGIFLMAFSGSLKGRNDIDENIIRFFDTGKLDLTLLLLVGSALIGGVFVLFLSKFLQRFINNNQSISLSIIGISMAMIAWFLSVI